MNCCFHVKETKCPKHFSGLNCNCLICVVTANSFSENPKKIFVELHKTLKLIVSRCFLGENEKRMHQNEKPTCNACKTFAVFSLCRFVSFSFSLTFSLL